MVLGSYLQTFRDHLKPKKNFWIELFLLTTVGGLSAVGAFCQVEWKDIFVQLAATIYLLTFGWIISQARLSERNKADLAKIATMFSTRK